MRLKQKADRKKNLLPLPEGVEVGKLVRYYRRGWHCGTLREVKGNKAAVMPMGYNCDNEKQHGKWIGIDDLRKLED